MISDHQDHFLKLRLISFIPLLILFLLSSTVEAQKTFTIEEVSKHNSSSDCWLIILKKVYDVTDYLELHPSSPGTIESWCGSIATDGMERKGIGVDHSEEAYALLNQYLIGNLE
ncbi:MAG: cytochrome b5 domain-containing protein [Cellvibrionaceae bacterium]